MQAEQLTAGDQTQGVDTQSQSPPTSLADREVALADAEAIPTLYWGVSSGSSIKALRVASQGQTLTDHEWTVNGAESPAPGFAEISFATTNRNQIFEGPEWFVDCGGFSELVENGVYDFDVEDYIQYIAKHADSGIEIGYWAMRDWPITKGLLRANDRTERTHQRWTVRDHVKSLELAEEYGLTSRSGCEPMAVIQGEDMAGYLWHLDHLREHGLIQSDRVCLGALKKLSASEVKDIGEAVRDALPSKYTIHGLGLTQQHLRYPGIREVFDSIDTQAWNKGTNRLPEKFDAIKNTWIGYLRAYEQYADTITAQETRDDQGQGTRLFEFGGGKESVAGHYDDPLRECVCGTLVDPNAVRDAYDDSVTTENTEQLDALDAGGCRHCRRSMLNIALQMM